MTGCYSCSSSTVCTQCMNNLVLSGNSCGCSAGSYQAQIGDGWYCINGVSGASYTQ